MSGWAWFAIGLAVVSTLFTVGMLRWFAICREMDDHNNEW